jgi:hypothetical protein
MTVSQEKIALLLMQMNHGKDGPNNNGNKEASGSQGGTRHHTETDHQLHTEGHSLFGGAPSRGPTNNRATPRPYMPTFLEAQQQDNYFPEVEDNFEEYAREYAALSTGFRRQVTLDQYCGIKYRGRPRSYHRGSNELEHGAGKMEIPTFDGLARTTAQAWVQKLNAYL